MPSSRAENEGGIEEERRLMYVAITRAEKQLYLTRSKSRYLYGHRDLTTPSKFVNELASELGVQTVRSSYGGYGAYGSRQAESYRPTGKALYSSDDGYESDFPANTSSSFKPAFVSSAPKKNNTAAKYTVGMRVRHSKFGNGMVIAVKNNGAVINVAFEGHGIKELSAAIAPLEKL